VFIFGFLNLMLLLARQEKQSGSGDDCERVIEQAL
jgi:hypothetical protein